MSHKEILARVCTALAFSLSAPTLAHAMQQSISSAGVPYVSGGGTEDERQFLKHMQTHYSAWLITRNRATGSALAGAHLRIIDTKTRRIVFDRTLDDPWLLLALPEGRFQIEALFDGQIQRWVVVSHPSDAVPEPLYLDLLAQRRTTDPWGIG